MKKWKRLTALLLTGVMGLSTVETTAFTVSAAAAGVETGGAGDVSAYEDEDYSYDEDVEYDYEADNEAVNPDQESAFSKDDLEDADEWEYNEDAEDDSYEEGDWGDDLPWGDGTEKVTSAALVDNSSLGDDEEGYWSDSNFWNMENTDFSQDADEMAWENDEEKEDYEKGFVNYLNSVTADEKAKYLKVEKATDAKVDDSEVLDENDVDTYDSFDDIDEALKKDPENEDGTGVDIETLGEDQDVSLGEDEELGDEETVYLKDDSYKEDDDDAYYLYYPEDMSDETWSADNNQDGRYAQPGEISGERVGLTDSENATYSYADDYTDSVTEEERDSLNDEEEEGEETDLGAVDYYAAKTVRPAEQAKAVSADAAAFQKQDVSQAQEQSADMLDDPAYVKYISALTSKTQEGKGEQLSFAASKVNYVSSARLYTRDALLKESSEYAYWCQGESRYYYDRMSAPQKAVYDQLMVVCLRYMMGKTPSVWNKSGYMLKDYVYSNQLDLKQMASVYKLFRMSNPQFYFIKVGYFYNKSTSGTTTFLYPKIYPTFSRGTGRLAMKKRIESARAAYHKTLNGKGWSNASEEERGLAIHNWIVGHVDYDHFAKSTVSAAVLARGSSYSKVEAGKRKPDGDKTFSQSIYSVFVPKKKDYPRAYYNGKVKNDNMNYYTVCMGYSAAFTLLCRMEGIEAVTVTSEKHAWNEVKFRTFIDGSRNNNGSWYMTDVTWDDTGSWDKYPVKRIFQYFERSTHWIAEREKSLKKKENHALEARYASFNLESSQPELAPLPDMYFLQKGGYMKNAKGGYMGLSYRSFVSASKRRYRYDSSTRKFVQNDNGNYIKHQVGTRVVKSTRKIKERKKQPYQVVKKIPVRNKKTGKIVKWIKKKTTKYKWVTVTKTVPTSRVVPLFVYLRYTEVFNKAGCYRNNGQSNYAWTRYVGLNADGSKDSSTDEEPKDGAGTEDIATLIVSDTGNSSTASSAAAQTSGTAAASGSSSSSSSSSGGGGGGSSKETSFNEGGVRSAGSGSSKAGYVKTGKNTVRFTLSQALGKGKKVVIPAKVKIGKKTYKVTSIARNAFAGENQVTCVVVGKNIQKISRGAFNGLDKLKTITIKSEKLKKKGVKGAFEGSGIQTVAVPEDKLKPYKEIFTKANTVSRGKLTVKKDKK